MKAQWNLLIVLSLLLGLVAYCPSQHVSAATDDAVFTLTSSLNPSAYTQKVTFTLSATVTGETALPFGYVDFRDNSTMIPDCSMIYLNYDGNQPQENIPAECETSTLTEGTHVITADFIPVAYGYENTTFTLEGGQTVTEPFPLTISPATLPDGEYGMNVDQLFFATYSDSSVCADHECVWDYSGDLPDSVGSAGFKGWILGQVEEVGTFNFTVTAGDGDGALGSREYTWKINKSIPQVTVQDRTIGSYNTVYMYANVSHAQNPNITPPPGTLSFFLDGEPVDDCTDMARREDGSVECVASFDDPLEPGIYPILVEFTPDDLANEYYNSGSGSGTLTVAANIEVQLFRDLDQDGVRDADTELPPAGTWRTNLDQECDGSVDYWDVIYDGTGYFSFSAVPPGFRYCLSVVLSGTWRQTTTVDEFIMGFENKSFEIGLFYPRLYFDPVDDGLLKGTLGEAFQQKITITGGVEPYSITQVLDDSLPEGLTFNTETFTLSGTPTAVGAGYLSFEVQDSEGLTGYWSSMVEILTHGSYDLTANPNPSVSGQAVTFTFTGSGDVIFPDDGPIPPHGMVTFFDGDTVIAGCEDLALNYDPELGLIDLPAVCTTAALADGLHEIKVVFSSFGSYHDKVLTLNHQVEASSNSTTSIFLPMIMMGP